MFSMSEQRFVVVMAVLTYCVLSPVEVDSVFVPKTRLNEPIPVALKDRKTEWYIQFGGSCDVTKELTALFSIAGLGYTPENERSDEFFKEYQKFTALVCLSRYYEQDPPLVTGMLCLDEGQCGCEVYQVLDEENGKKICRTKPNQTEIGTCGPLSPCVKNYICMYRGRKINKSVCILPTTDPTIITMGQNSTMCPVSSSGGGSNSTMEMCNCSCSSTTNITTTTAKNDGFGTKQQSINKFLMCWSIIFIVMKP